MGIRIRKHGTVIAQFASAQQVDISHTSDSIRIGDGTDLLSLVDVGGTKSIPVDVKAIAAGTLATSDNQTNGTQRTKVTDGTDNVEIDDVGGEKALKVSVIATVGGSGSGTASSDSAAYTAGSSSFTPIGGAYDDVASDALAEGEMGMVRMTAARALHVQIQNTSLTIADGGDSITVDGTVAATQSGTWNIGDISGTVSLPTGAATSAKQDTIIGHLDGVEGILTTIDADTGSIDTRLASAVTALQIMDDWDATAGSAHPSDGVMAMGSDGTNARRLKTDSSGELQVDVLTLPSIALAASTNNIGDVDVLTLPGVTGAAAHDAGVSGNPVRIAGRAMLDNGTAVAEDDTADIATDNQGRVVVTPHVPRDLVTHATGAQTNTTEATMLSAAGAGVFLDVTKIILTNSNTTTAAQVQIRDATTGTIRLEMIIAPSGGAVIDFGNVPMCQTTANNNWTIDLQANVSTVYWYIQAIKRIA